MAAKELAKPSLTGEIRRQISLNQEMGDKEIDDKGQVWFKWFPYGFTVIENYDNDFRTVLNNSTTYDILKDRHLPVAIDLMGPSEAIADLFEKIQGKSKLGIAVSLEDLRSDEQKARDEKLGIIQIAGDILKSSTWEAIEENLQGRKADLIIERAVGCLYSLPRYQKLYAILINKAWQILSDQNGVMLLQIPSDQYLREIGIDVQSVISDLRKNGVNVECAESRATKGLFLKLVKTPNSPEKLPF